MYTYKDIHDMINKDFPCLNIQYGLFGNPCMSDICIYKFYCDIANIADYLLYFGVIL